MKRLSLASLSFVAIAFLVSSEGLASALRASRRMSGFSPDSRYYLYLESFSNTVTEVPTAQIQMVDLETNSCVRNGCLKTEYDLSASNLTTKAAGDDILKRTAQLRYDLQLTLLKVGIRLPMIARQPNPDSSETYKFLINDPKEPLQITLEQKYIPAVEAGGTFGTERASMRLVVNYNYRQLAIGDLNNYREAVQKYAIREVRLSPNRRNAVVLIDMTQPSYEGLVQTTFVQSFPIERLRTQ
jgi:predicted secreted protein